MNSLDWKCNAELLCQDNFLTEGKRISMHFSMQQPEEESYIDNKFFMNLNDDYDDEDYYDDDFDEYEDELLKLRGKVTLIAGGPPCQGFSLAGRRNENDERNKLVDSYVRFVGIVMPKIVFFENVKGFTAKFQGKDSLGRRYSDYVLNKLKKLGYNVHPGIINFGEYGVPQNRKRFP